MIWESLQGEKNKAKRKRRQKGDKRKPEEQKRGEMTVEADKQERVEQREDK